MAEQYNICLDVGGTKVLGAIFNEKDEIIYRLKKRSKSGGEGAADVEKVIIDVVEEMIRESGIDRKKINAIASCAPGVIDQNTGVVLFTPNLPWRNYDLAGAMRKQFGVPFFVGNDVNLGVLGEYKFGAAQGYRNVAGFFVGTGLGGGLILNGSLFTGNQFKAAEYGHMILDPEGPLCNCGQRGCLEAFSSKQGMSAYIRQQVSRGRETMMAEAVQDGVFRSKKLKKALAAGDAVAVDATAQLSQLTTEGLRFRTRHDTGYVHHISHVLQHRFLLRTYAVTQRHGEDIVSGVNAIVQFHLVGDFVHLHLA